MNGARVAVIQSNYMPWRGYFDFIASVDLFLIYDVVQFTKNDWRNRNRLRVNSGGTKWLTVPIAKHKLGTPVDQTLCESGRDWRTEHLNMFRQNYQRAPAFAEAHSLFQACLSTDTNNLSLLNEHSLKTICSALNINTPIERCTSQGEGDTPTARLISVLRRVGAQIYLSGPNAESYLELDLFKEAGLGLEYKSYDYSEYPQIHRPFEPQLSVLDLIANVGSQAAKFLRSRSPNRTVV